MMRLAFFTLLFVFSLDGISQSIPKDAYLIIQNLFEDREKNSTTLYLDVSSEHSWIDSLRDTLFLEHVFIRFKSREDLKRIVDQIDLDLLESFIKKNDGAVWDRRQIDRSRVKVAKKIPRKGFYTVLSVPYIENDLAITREILKWKEETYSDSLIFMRKVGDHWRWELILTLEVTFW